MPMQKIIYDPERKSVEEAWGRKGTAAGGEVAVGGGQGRGGQCTNVEVGVDAFRRRVGGAGGLVKIVIAKSIKNTHKIATYSCNE